LVVRISNPSTVLRTGLFRILAVLRSSQQVDIRISSLLLFKWIKVL